MLNDRGFTRVPVIGEKKKVKGVLYSKDLLTARKGTIRKILRDPFLVSVDDEVTEIFDVMKQNRIHLAVVKDVKGNHVGIVTLEDLIEELVGEIHDEYFEKKYSKYKLKDYS